MASYFLLSPDKQSNSASLETLLALLQAEGAKIEEDTEVRLDDLMGIPQHVSGSPCQVSGPVFSRTWEPHTSTANTGTLPKHTGLSGQNVLGRGPAGGG